MQQTSRNVFWPDGTSIIEQEEQRETIATLKPGILQKVILDIKLTY